MVHFCAFTPTMKKDGSLFPNVEKKSSVLNNLLEMTQIHWIWIHLAKENNNFSNEIFQLVKILQI